MTGPGVSQRVLASAAFGTLMVGAAAVGADRLIAVGALFLAGMALVAGLYLPAAATVAVLTVECATVLSDQQGWVTAISGLSAAAYLTLRYSTMTVPTALGLVGFAVVGIVATAAPVNLSWLPLIAPIAVVVVFAVALAPFAGERARRALPPPGPRP